MAISSPSNKQLADWYMMLAQQLEAGITLSQAIQLTDIITPENRYDIVHALEGGMKVDEVFERFAPWMPPTDRKLIAAANAAGKLPETLHNLSARRAAMSENVRNAVAACVYPIFIVHLAAFVTPIFDLLDLTSGSLQIHFEKYIPMVAIALGIAWALIITAGVLLKQNNPKVLGFFPVIKDYSKHQAVSDFASLVGSFLKAGATFDVAWEEAGNASRDSRLTEFALGIADKARAGIAPGTLLNPKGGILPTEFVSLYVSGEQTGQLEKNLDLLAKLFQEKANQKLKQASEWYPVAIFLCVAVYVGWGIVRFYTQYMDLLMSIIRPGHKVGH